MQQQGSRREFLAHSTALIGLGIDLSLSPPREGKTPYRVPREFAAFQERRRRGLWGLLGDLPQNYKPRPSQLISTEKHDGYRLGSHEEVPEMCAIVLE